MSSRRALQIITTILSFIPIVTGLVGFSGLRDPLYVHFGVVPNAVLDSNLRFFCGFWLGGGLTMLWVARHIEKEGALFRALWLMIFLGGIGRVLSLAFAGAPPPPFYGILALELVGAPVFIVWQRNVERDAQAEQRAGV